MTKKIHLAFTVLEESCGRIDRFLSEKKPELSRSLWQTWIKAGLIRVNGHTVFKRSLKLKAGDRLSGEIQPESTRCIWEAEALPLTIVFEDDQLIVLNKPVDCVVHPGTGHKTGTLVNALLHYAPILDHLPRAGIIHRLDKDTTGLIVVPKTLTAHYHLSQQLQNRTMKRHYRAIVFGELISGAMIDQPLGRHPKIKTKMAVVSSGKPAVTYYRIQKKMLGFTELAIQLETGRTHQIRIHLSYAGFPIVGDPLYRRRHAWSKGVSNNVKHRVMQFKCQALHAHSLSFTHPTNLKLQSFSCEPPNDYKILLADLAAG